MSKIVTVEEHARQSGFGSAVLELLARKGIQDCRVEVMGFGDKFVQQGARDYLLEEDGLTADGIAGGSWHVVERSHNGCKIYQKRETSCLKKRYAWTLLVKRGFMTPPAAQAAIMAGLITACRRKGRQGWHSIKKDAPCEYWVMITPM